MVVTGGPLACRFAVGLGKRTDSATALKNVSDVDAPETALAKDQAVFDYPFNKLGVSVILGQICADNTEALKLNRHLGFKVVAEIPNEPNVIIMNELYTNS